MTDRRVPLDLSRLELFLFAGLLPVLLVSLGFYAGRSRPDRSVTEQATLAAAIATDAAVALTDDFDDRQSVVDSFLPPEQTEIPSTAQGAAPAGSELLQRELRRLQRYESQLRKRASFLDAILEDLERMDFDFNEVSDSAAEIRRRPSRRLAVGGVDKRRRVPFYRSVPEETAPRTADSEDGAPDKRPPAPTTQSPVGKNTGTKKVSLLLRDLDVKLARLATVPLGAPVQGELTSPYGYRRSPFTGSQTLHTGVDFAIDRASSVAATADGIVVNAGRKGGYGKTVIIRHGHRVETLYGHLSRVLVEPGQRVCRGQQIGLVGSTGRSTGPHLHYEVRIDGDAVDPLRFVRLASFFRYIDPERHLAEPENPPADRIASGDADEREAAAMAPAQSVAPPGTAEAPTLDNPSAPLAAERTAASAG